MTLSRLPTVLRRRWCAARWPSEDEGQGLVEYALIILLVALPIIVVLGQYGGAVSALYQGIVDDLPFT